MLDEAVLSHSAPSARPANGSGTGIAATVPIRLPATFSFSCYETAFDAVVVHCPGDGARLTVRGHLGTLPYSAECPTTRRYMHAVVDAGNELPFAEISVTSTQSIMVRGTMDFAATPTPASVAAGASVIAVAMKPLVELMAACRMMARERRA
jgi:hypothetical protein